MHDHIKGLFDKFNSGKMPQWNQHNKLINAYKEVKHHLNDCMEYKDIFKMAMLCREMYILSIPNRGLIEADSNQVIKVADIRSLLSKPTYANSNQV